MNTIIIAALVLIVLVVLILILTGQMGEWVTNVEEQKESKCPDGTDPVSKCPEGQHPATVTLGGYCCVDDEEEEETNPDADYGCTDTEQWYLIRQEDMICRSGTTGFCCR